MAAWPPRNPGPCGRPATHGNVAALQPRAALRSALGDHVNAPSGRSRGCTCWTAKNRFLCRFLITSLQPQADGLLAPKGPKQVSPGQSAAAKPRSAALGRSGSSIIIARDGISPERAKQGDAPNPGRLSCKCPFGANEARNPWQRGRPVSQRRPATQGGAALCPGRSCECPFGEKPWLYLLDGEEPILVPISDYVPTAPGRWSSRPEGA